MRLFGGIVGALLGLGLGVVLVEVIFANSQSWPDVVPFALAVAGWLAGWTLAKRDRPQPGAARTSRSR